MIVQQQIAIAEHILSLGTGVSKVYHSCELVRDTTRGIVGACYRTGKEYNYVGIDDSKGFYAYLRYNGDAIATPNKVGSCAGYSNLSTPMRAVFFHDEETRDHAVLTDRLTQFSFLTNVSLTRVVLDKFALVKAESDQVRESFDAGVYYVAFDFLINTVVLPSSCEPDLCATFTNPIITP